MNEFLILLSLENKIVYNKINSIIKIPKRLSNIVIMLYSLLKELLNKTLYMFIFIVTLTKYDRLIAINLFIVLSIVGFIINTLMFDKSETKQYLFAYLKIRGKYLKKYYYYKVIKQSIGMLLGISILVQLCNLSYNYIIYFLLFIINGKTLFNSIFLFIFNKKKFLYQEDNPTILVYTTVIILFLIYIISIITRIDLLFIIHVVNYIGIFSHLYLIKYNNYDKVLIKNNFYIADYNLEKDYKIRYKNNISESNMNKYLVKIFRQRYLKYYIIYILKYLLLLSIIIFFNSNSPKIFIYLIGIIYFFSPTEKIIDLYYYRCDKYLFSNITKTIKNERIKELLLINLVTFLPLIICNYRYIFTIIIYILCIVILYINIYMYLKPYNINNNYKKRWYYLLKIIISIIFIII